MLSANANASILVPVPLLVLNFWYNADLDDFHSGHWLKPTTNEMKICADVYVESVVDFALTAAGLKSYTCAASEFVDIYPLHSISRHLR